MAKVVSVIDIGSNSARMAIFQRTSRFGFHLIHEVKSKVRISEGCYENGGVLQEVPMQRALNALKEFLSIANSYKSRKIFCVATSALRDAPNSKDFLARARKECGVNIKVIDGDKEAFFGGVACANLLHKKDGITIDIGGGSTECALIKNGNVRDKISLNIGTIRIKELFFDRIDSENLPPVALKTEFESAVQNAKAFIQKELKKIPDHFFHRTIFGIGGTIRAFAKLIQKHTNYPIDRIHAYEFDLSVNRHLFDKIYHTQDLSDLGVPADRFDTIRSGALIFEMILSFMGAEHIITSGAGVREGVFLADLLRNQNYKFPPNFYPSVASLKDRFGVNEKFSESMKKTAFALFDSLAHLHKCNEKSRELLGICAQLCAIGENVNFYESNYISAFLVSNGLEYGFSHIESLILETLILYSDRKLPRENAPFMLTLNSLESAQAKLLENNIISQFPSLEKLQWLSFILGLSGTLMSARENLKFRIEVQGEQNLDSEICINIFVNQKCYLAKECVQKLQLPLENLKINIFEE